MSSSSEYQSLLAQAARLHRAGRLGEAASSYRELLQFTPDDVPVLHALGVAHTELLEYKSAVQVLTRCESLAPNSSAIKNSLGMALYPAGEHERAVQCFRSALAIDPANFKAANNLGNAYLRLRNVEEARKAFELALRIKPDHRDARSNLGHCLLISGAYEDACRQFDQVIIENPESRPALEGLAQAYLALDRYAEVVVQRRRLQTLEPTNPTRLHDLGVALQLIDRHDEAIDCYHSAIQIDPADAEALTRIGMAQLEMGRLSEAHASLSAACRAVPTCARYRYLQTSSCKVSASDGSLESLRKLLAASQALPSQEQVYLHFAVAKALADTGDQETAFRHYLEANRIKRRDSSYDEKTTLEQVSRAGQLFPSELTRAGEPRTSLAPTPIFIVGMPRTGSTLVEQILAAHPDVFALGELKALREVVQLISREKKIAYPEWLPSLSNNDLVAIASDYLARVHDIARARHPNRPFTPDSKIVDKMPGNYLFSGLIHLAMPSAKIIHTRRDAVDTCLSCFQTHFEGLLFTSDLAELGRYYRRYADLMATWSKLLPSDSILDVDYERLVEDFEGHARSIIAHCGLSWNDACLDFHRVSRPVRTASATQVRQPLFSPAVRGWKPSNELLEPLLQELGI